MQAQAYEHPLKSGARGVVRQIFLFWLISTIAAALIFGHDQHWQTVTTFMGWAVDAVIGAFVAIPLWALYRLARFAVG